MPKPAMTARPLNGPIHWAPALPIAASQPADGDDAAVNSCAAGSGECRHDVRTIANRLMRGSYWPRIAGTRMEPSTEMDSVECVLMEAIEARERLSGEVARVNAVRIESKRRRELLQYRVGLAAGRSRQLRRKADCLMSASKKIAECVSSPPRLTSACTCDGHRPGVPHSTPRRSDGNANRCRQ